MSETATYILDDAGEPVPRDYETCAMWFANHMDRRFVARSAVGDATVATVFLGVDHGFGERPKMWETMIMGGGSDGFQLRHGGTRADAEAMHEEVVALAGKP